MAARKNLSSKRVAKALMAAGGNVSRAAALLGCSRTAVYEAIRRDAELMGAVLEVRERLIDEAEAALEAAVKKGEKWAICFVLRYLGWSRGYGQRPVAEEQPTVKVEIDVSKLPDDILRGIQRLARESRASGQSATGQAASA